MVSKSKKLLRFDRQLALYLFDTAVFVIVYAMFAFLCTQASPSSALSVTDYVSNAFVLYALEMAMRLVFRVYYNVWRYATQSGYLRLILADFFGGAMGLLVCYLFGVYIGVWKTVEVVSVQCLACISARLAYQFINGSKRMRSKSHTKYVVIAGAGSIGTALVKELRLNDKSEYHPYCFVDDDPGKVGRMIDELRVYNSSSDKTLEILRKSPVEEVIIALDPSSSSTIKRWYDRYSKAGFKVRIYDFASDTRDVPADDKRRLRDISIEDLLFRKPVEIPQKDIDNYSGRTVLVTGGGGSIGSEICRQIAGLSPKRLVVFDIYENNAYDLQQELIRKYGKSIDLCVEIGSVRDRKRLDELFCKYRPDVVFHAAAHKHVPLMEYSPAETVKNNVLGTYNTADMAEKYGVTKFILVSTDKAVNPTNVMGASKRMCEMIVQSRIDSATSFAAVRFGNVLGSNGSVIPLFRRQIEAGGPVTITDKRIIRYFMTIPEASRLVLLAGAYAERGELFVLDMGEPVAILDLAENLIRMSGYEPYKEIKIEEIGLRPGEKLFEELLIRTENQKKTENSLIFVENDTPLTRAEVDARIKLLVDAVENSGNDSDAIKNAYREAVPSFVDPSEINDKVADSAEKIVAAAVSGIH